MKVLDYCALYFPPKKFITILVEFVSPAVQSQDALQRRAALAALAITAEGCAGFYFRIKINYIYVFLYYVSILIHFTI
jgi:hypothetical protein